MDIVLLVYFFSPFIVFERCLEITHHFVKVADRVVAVTGKIIVIAFFREFQGSVSIFKSFGIIELPSNSNSHKIICPGLNMFVTGGIRYSGSFGSVF